MRLRHVYPLSSYNHRWGWFFNGNASVGRRALQAAGGFDETLQFWSLDDTDLRNRLDKSSATFWHTPRARASHLPGIVSGGGKSRYDGAKSCRFQMKVLYRIYLDDDILTTYNRFWARLGEAHVSRLEEICFVFFHLNNDRGMGRLLAHPSHRGGVTHGTRADAHCG
jgi:GT2 family glycosyltransferase